MHVGVVKELWRYPVKSMRGEQLCRSHVGSKGVTADRLYGVRDAVSSRIISAKRMAGLFDLRACYLEDDVEIQLPDGTRVTSGSQEELPRQRGVLRTIARVNDNKLGVVGSVVSPGRVSVGDRKPSETELQERYSGNDEPLENFPTGATKPVGSTSK